MRVLKKDGTPWEIEDEDILQYKSHLNTLIVVTLEGEFIYPTSLSDIHSAHQDIGYERLDRSNVVNINKVTSYDSDRKIVFFKDSTTSFAVVSESNEIKIKRIMKQKEEG
jgi:DNA-binding LytR/AlgR family response regulator